MEVRLECIGADIQYFLGASRRIQAKLLFHLEK